MDPISVVFITFGVILIAAGWIQLLITSFKEDYTWGLTTLFLPPLSYIYSLAAAMGTTTSGSPRSRRVSPGGDTTGPLGRDRSAVAALPSTG